MATLTEVEIKVHSGTPAAGAAVMWELLTNICGGPVESWHNPELVFSEVDNFLSSAKLNFDGKIYIVLSVLS
jgi:hypothetical protein